VVKSFPLFISALVSHPYLSSCCKIGMYWWHESTNFAMHP
jgi:hypothetical protein